MENQHEGKAIVVATANSHKGIEISQLLGCQKRILTLKDLGLSICWTEDGLTFQENAIKKVLCVADALAKKQPPWRQILVLGDDSGLEVDALGGEPGVYSARFAEIKGVCKGRPTDADNNALLLKLLNGVPWEKRTARFVCVIALLALEFNDTQGARQALKLFTGTCHGKICFEPRGVNGFGYDPLFQPEGYELTFGEMPAEEKNRISHRARAIEQVKQYLHSNPEFHQFMY